MELCTRVQKTSTQSKTLQFHFGIRDDASSTCKLPAVTYACPRKPWSSPGSPRRLQDPSAGAGPWEGVGSGHASPGSLGFGCGGEAERCFQDQVLRAACLRACPVQASAFALAGDRVAFASLRLSARLNLAPASVAALRAEVAHEPVGGGGPLRRVEALPARMSRRMLS